MQFLKLKFNLLFKNAEKSDPKAFRDIILQGLNDIIASTQSGLSNNPKDSQEAVVLDSIDKPNIESKESSERGSIEELNKENVDNGQTDGVDESIDQQTDLEHTKQESNGETNKQEETVVELINTEIVIEQAQFEALSKFLDVSGSKLNYRHYGEVLLDILIAGGTLGEIYIRRRLRKNLFTFFFS